jgi:hypothetical protein
MTGDEHDDDEHDVEDEPLAWFAPTVRPPHQPQPCRVPNCTGTTRDRGSSLCPPHARADERWGQPEPVNGPTRWSTYR